MLNIKNQPISPELSQSIEDAILFGHVKELDSIVELIGDDVGFPEDIRHGLEALRYFRAYYGKDGDLEPTNKLQKQQVIVMESAWGSELLSLLHEQEFQPVAQRQA